MARLRKTKATSHPFNKRKITPDDLLKFLFVGDPQISPDGDRILFTKKYIGEKNEYITNLYVVPAEKGSPRQFTSGEKDSHGRWSPDGKTIAFISNRDETPPQIFTIPASGGEATTLTKFPEGSIGSFKWSPDGTMLAVSFRETDPEWTEEAKQKREQTGASLPARVIDDMYYRLDGDGYFNRQRFQLFIVDISTGEHRVLFDRDTIGWFNYDWSPNFRELVVSTNTDKNALVKYWKWDLYRVAVGTGKAKRIPNLPSGAKTIVAWSPNGKQIAFAGNTGKECWGVNNTHLYVCDINGGNVRNLTDHSDYCLSAVTLSDSAEATFDEKFLWSPNGKRIFMNFGWQGGTQIASIKSSGGEVLFHTKDRKSVSMGNISSDGMQIALTVGDQMTLDEVAVGRMTSPAGTGSLRIAKRSQFNKSLLAELDLSQAESHWIPSTDGTKVHVWVMKPVGFKPGKKYPAILEIHGGPHTQYGEAFFHEFQVLAAAGYTVVYSNPRGSKGYGEEHCTAIKGNWGNADWKDIQAVTAFMKQLPFVNAKKMGISGGSYGGYMTNWAIGHTDEFAAAVTDRCVSNLVSMVGSSDLPLVPGEYWKGNSWDDTDAIWEQSPLKHFGNVTTPTLVIHSEGDLRCNVEQSEQVFAALKLREIPTRFVRYPSTTSHGLSRYGPPDLRLHRLAQYLDWWKKYLK
jgi:dipeptidyl aminopeptidase/acylaminoacyl peptidase